MKIILLKSHENLGNVGDIVNVKHRTKEKRFYQEKNAIKTLYNVDNLKEIWDMKKVIFVEDKIINFIG